MCRTIKSVEMGVILFPCTPPVYTKLNIAAAHILELNRCLCMTLSDEDYLNTFFHLITLETSKQQVKKQRNLVG